MKQFFRNLGKNRLVIIIPMSLLTLVAFVLSLVAIITYGANCGSEFNGGKVSSHVLGLGTAGIIFGGIALLMDLAAFFLVRSPKSAYLFSLSRIGNYGSFVLLLGAFLFQILDEYSLLGTILYPIVSGTAGGGDPVDPTLATCYFVSLILLFVALLHSLVAGIILRKTSYRIIKENQPTESEVPSNE